MRITPDLVGSEKLSHSKNNFSKIELYLILNFYFPFRAEKLFKSILKSKEGRDEDKDFSDSSSDEYKEADVEVSSESYDESSSDIEDGDDEQDAESEISDENSNTLFSNVGRSAYQESKEMKYSRTVVQDVVDDVRHQKPSPMLLERNKKL